MVVIFSAVTSWKPVETELYMAPDPEYQTQLKECREHVSWTLLLYQPLWLC